MQPFDTDFAIGDEFDIRDQIIEQRASLSQLRALLNNLDFSHKIAIAQIACNQIGSAEPGQLIKLKPFGEHFDEQLQAAIVWMGSLPPETLAEIAIEILIEILEKPQDRNE